VPDLESLRYPIGKYTAPEVITPAQRGLWLEDLRRLPGLLRAAAGAADLTREYRPGGWTGRQVVHHVADSHMNSFIRFKLALTEDTPTIKPYDEALWAELADQRLTPEATSLSLVDGIHERWLHVLEAMTEADWQRKFRHPEIGEVDLSYALGLYSWHGRHHLGHLGLIKK
jgi:hypothetical protein